METLLNSLFKPLLAPTQKFNDLLSPFDQAAKHSHPNPQALLETALGEALNKSLTSVPPVSEPDATNFSPTAVANRIADYVATTVSQTAASETEAKTMLEQAKQGIEQGIAQARDVLDSLGKLSAEVDSMMSETESLIYEKLDKLMQTTADTTDISPRGQIISSAGAISSQISQSREASIEIVTQDGDRVEVSYTAFQQASSNQSYFTNSQQSAASFEFQAQSSLVFQFEVRGELDAGEQKAINELLEKVGDIASQFFNGNVQAAFNSALELGIDSEELKSYSVDLQQSTSVQVVQSYQQTEQLYDPAQASPAGLLPGPGPAINVLTQLEQLLNQAKESALIQQPENTLKSLLAEVLEATDLDKQLGDELMSFMRELIEAT